MPNLLYVGGKIVVIQPFGLIDLRTVKIDEFQVSEGFQPTHAIFVVKSGSFEIDFGSGFQRAFANDIVILPNYVRFKRQITDPVECFYIRFKLNEDCPYSPAIPYGKIDFADKGRILSDINLLNKISDMDFIYAMYYRTHILEDILYQVILEHGDVSSENIICDKTVSCAVEFIKENLSSKIKLCDICKAAGCAVSTLNTKFNGALGMSPVNYLINLRLEHSAYLLRTTSHTVEAVAEKSGFENVYYFSASFKKKYGVSPSKYRNIYI